MTIIESDTSPAFPAAVDPTFNAMRVSLYPREFNKSPGPPLGGHYRMAAVTGLTTLIASGGALFSLRWAETSLRAVIQRLQVSAAIITPFTTAQELSVDLVKVVNFSAADSGGTSMLPLNDFYKKKTTMANSIVSDARIATIAALTLGTGIAQPPMASMVMPFIVNGIGAPSASAVPLFDIRPGEEAPIELGPSEGLRVRLGNTMGVVGVIRWHLIMDWAEVPNIQ